MVCHIFYFRSSVDLKKSLLCYAVLLQAEQVGRNVRDRRDNEAVKPFGEMSSAKIPTEDKKDGQNMGKINSKSAHTLESSYISTAKGTENNISNMFRPLDAYPKPSPSGGDGHQLSQNEAKIIPNIGHKLVESNHSILENTTKDTENDITEKFRPLDTYQKPLSPCEIVQTFKAPGADLQYQDQLATNHTSRTENMFWHSKPPAICLPLTGPLAPVVPGLTGNIFENISLKSSWSTLALHRCLAQVRY